jgi:ATP-dependent RNA helicase DDX24/MAK5
MPVNAETYVHRCGRTARIGKHGLSFSLLSPEDEKNFRLIYKNLNKGATFETNGGEEGVIGDIKEYEIDLPMLQKYKAFIDKAGAVEKAVFDKGKQKQNADWVIKLAEDTGLEIPDEMKKEMDILDERVELKTN